MAKAIKNSRNIRNILGKTSKSIVALQRNVRNKSANREAPGANADLLKFRASDKVEAARLKAKYETFEHKDIPEDIHPSLIKGLMELQQIAKATQDALKVLEAEAKKVKKDKKDA